MPLLGEGARNTQKAILPDFKRAHNIVQHIAGLSKSQRTALEKALGTAEEKLRQIANVKSHRELAGLLKTQSASPIKLVTFSSLYRTPKDIRSRVNKIIKAVNGLVAGLAMDERQAALVKEEAKKEVNQLAAGARISETAEIETLVREWTTLIKQVDQPLSDFKKAIALTLPTLENLHAHWHHLAKTAEAKACSAMLAALTRACSAKVTSWRGFAKKLERVKSAQELTAGWKELVVFAYLKNLSNEMASLSRNFDTSPTLATQQLHSRIKSARDVLTKLKRKKIKSASLNELKVHFDGILKMTDWLELRTKCGLVAAQTKWPEEAQGLFSALIKKVMTNFKQACQELASKK
jgi:hypothetical protein